MANIVKYPKEPMIQPVPEENIGLSLFNSFSKHQDDLAINDISLNVKVTYKELKNKSEILARHLLNMGCCVGDTIGIYCRNSIEWFLLTAAALRIGAARIYINPYEAEGYVFKDDVKHQFNISKIKILYTTPDLTKFALDNTKMDPGKVIVKGGYKGCISLESLFEVTDSLPKLPTFEQQNIKPDDVTHILFSSSTSGDAKAVPVTHRNMQARILGNKCLEEKVALAEPIMFYLPLLYVSQVERVFTSLAYGATILLQSGIIGAETFLKCLHDNKIGSIFFAPTVVLAMCKSRQKIMKPTHLKNVLTGGSPLYSEMEKTFRSRFPGVTFSQVYGSTETGIVSVTPKVDSDMTEKKQGSVGLPVENIRIKFVDLKKGSILGPGEKGEIWVKSELISPGYLDHHQAIAPMVDEDGWFHTGDFGYYDEDGYLYVLDRVKDLIHTKDLLIPPSELQTILLSHPEVVDAAVFGIPETSGVTAGEVPFAWVVKAPGSTVTEKDLDLFFSAKVSPQKRLSGGIKFAESIPRAGGKVSRRVMKAATI